MIDNTYYITPHETALAVVATAMKKARLQLNTLVINSIVGAVLFSTGGMLYLAGHADNRNLVESNPGLLNFLGGATFGIGLFFVVINGADLFNSNILFFSVGLLRNAISIYDLLISWIVSWSCNFLGTLFICYVICHLSGVTSSADWIKASQQIVESKASHSGVQIFIRGIAGNFYVCLAVYFQMMVKPIHVKLIVMCIPIFTFVSMGFTHVVADMYLILMGMINGADLSIGKFIWKLLIPGTFGNIAGGFIFAAVVPFYLHLVVVERDRKKLLLPEYEIRDEQPELNIDSRVVRVSDEETEEKGEEEEKYLSSNNHTYTSSSVENVNSQELSQHLLPLSKISSRKPHISSANQRGKCKIRSPPGVFPVKGMAEPLSRERTIANIYSTEHAQIEIDDKSIESEHANNLKDDGCSRNLGMPSNSNVTLSSSDYNGLLDQTEHTRIYKVKSSASRNMTTEAAHAKEEAEYTLAGGFNVREHTLGAKLQRVVSQITSHDKSQNIDNNEPILPLTSPDLHTVNQTTSDMKHVQRSHSFSQLIKTISKPLFLTKAPHDVVEIHRKFSEAGVTSIAANAADNIAGIDNYDGIDLPHSNSPFYKQQVNSLSYPAPAADPYGTQLLHDSIKLASGRRLSYFRSMVRVDNDDFEEQSTYECQIITENNGSSARQNEAALVTHNIPAKHNYKI
ncbi:uncharacterized protein Ecym_7246 [Eremothecium cymbalariae DBVPG|uniref:Formate/nitrite transporter n=1 Tax=Eremothecium cymbalariae (strain CBS 270.75 / DBVPG 7215 / KCTC 17166 / NRRL Y-17582) TaxID=931890 RepID=G8JW75_ERECY|nr:hypothetical protein Ecym_7246 [Eremothecium cymbalariae DBVPG\